MNILYACVYIYIYIYIYTLVIYTYSYMTMLVFSVTQTRQDRGLLGIRFDLRPISFARVELPKD